MEPIRAGDLCRVINALSGRKSPNIGLKVTVKHMVLGAHGEPHSRFGHIWRCEGAGLCQMNDMGEYIPVGWADIPAIWLEKIKPDATPPKSVEKKKELTT